MGGIPNPPIGWVQWFADGLRPSNALVRPDMIEVNGCGVCGREVVGDVHVMQVPDGSPGNYYMWEHTDGTTCTTIDRPAGYNHLQYWARESDRLREQERQRIEREARQQFVEMARGAGCINPEAAFEPIETRSIEEQQRERDREADAARVWQAWQESLRDRDQELAREQDNLLREASAATRIREEDRRRRIAADRESARRVNEMANIFDLAPLGAAQSQRGMDWSAHAGMRGQSYEEPPKPKKLPIVKPTKRKFNFASD